MLFLDNLNQTHISEQRQKLLTDDFSMFGIPLNAGTPGGVSKRN